MRPKMPTEGLTERLWTVQVERGKGLEESSIYGLLQKVMEERIFINICSAINQFDWFDFLIWGMQGFLPLIFGLRVFAVLKNVVSFRLFAVPALHPPPSPVHLSCLFSNRLFPVEIAVSSCVDRKLVSFCMHIYLLTELNHILLAAASEEMTSFRCTSRSCWCCACASVKNDVNSRATCSIILRFIIILWFYLPFYGLIYLFHFFFLDS